MSDVPKSVLYELEFRAQRIEKIQATAVLDLGRELFEARKIVLGRGDHFEKWLKDRLGVEKRGAYRAIHAYERFGSEGQFATQIPKSVLYELAAPSTPEEVAASKSHRDEVPVTMNFGQLRHARHSL